MPTFLYEAYNQAGRSEKGSLQSPNETDAVSVLKKKGLFVSKLSLKPANSSIFRRNKVSGADIALMTRRLATLFSSSVPAYEAFSILSSQERDGELKEALSRIRDRISEGSGISRALSEEPALFSESYVAMVGAGEESGSLDQVLDRLAMFLEEQESVKGTVSAAVAYPILMAIVGTGVMFFLLTFVIPKIVNVFAQSKAKLPFLTVVVIKISTFLQHWWWLLIAAAIALSYMFMLLRKKEKFRAKLDIIKLKLPVSGELLSKLILSRIARVLSLLLSGGVPIVKGLDIVSEVSSNTAFRRDIEKVKEDVIQGKSLSSALSLSPLFPPLLVQMIAVGEKSGRLEDVLEKGGLAFAGEFNVRLKRMMSLLEPMMVLLMGVGVGIVVVSVLLPIFEMNQLIK